MEVRVVQTGAYYVVKGVRALTPRVHRPSHVPGSFDNHLPQAWLDITCTDRITGEPVVGAAVIVVDLRQFMAGNVVHTGSTHRKDTVTDAAGFTQARILAHHRHARQPPTCDLHTSCTGTARSPGVYALVCKLYIVAQCASASRGP